MSLSQLFLTSVDTEKIHKVRMCSVMNDLLNQIPAVNPKTGLLSTEFKYQFLNILKILKSDSKDGDKQAEAIGVCIMFY